MPMYSSCSLAGLDQRHIGVTLERLRLLDAQILHDIGVAGLDRRLEVGLLEVLRMITRLIAGAVPQKFGLTSSTFWVCAPRRSSHTARCRPELSFSHVEPKSLPALAPTTFFSTIPATLLATTVRNTCGLVVAGSFSSTACGSIALKLSLVTPKSVNRKAGDFIQVDDPAPTE